MKKNRWINLLTVLFIFKNVLNADILELQITWNAFKCQNTCIAQIEQNFRAIKGVKNFRINSSSGLAAMEWEPTYSFNYEPFRYASAAVGIRISSMYVRVRGVVTHEADKFYILSNGDNTRFTLIGPIQVEAGRYTPKNLAAHPLTSDIKEKLLEIESGREVVIISGPLFLPSYHLNTLIIEDIKMDKKK